MMPLNKISTGFFGIIILCFLLPWLNVSCQGNTVVSLNGIQLAFGTTIDNQKISGETIVIIIFIMTFIGFVLSLIQNGRLAVANTFISISSIIMLLIEKSRINDLILKQGGGFLRVQFSIGFYFALLFFFAIIGANIYQFIKIKDIKGSAIVHREKKQIFCPECGSRNEFDNIFCSECGVKIK